MGTLWVRASEGLVSPCIPLPAAGGGHEGYEWGEVSGGMGAVPA